MLLMIPSPSDIDERKILGSNYYCCLIYLSKIPKQPATEIKKRENADTDIWGYPEYVLFYTCYLFQIEEQDSMSNVKTQRE